MRCQSDNCPATATMMVQAEVVTADPTLKTAEPIRMILPLRVCQEHGGKILATDPNAVLLPTKP